MKADKGIYIRICIQMILSNPTPMIYYHIQLHLLMVLFLRSSSGMAYI